MPKPMGSQCAGVLISSLLLLNFLLLLQLGTGATSYYRPIPVEDMALRYLIKSLQSNGITYVPLLPYCSNDTDAQIYCSCDNKTQACSITKINFRRKSLTGYIPFISAGCFKNLKVLDLSNNQLHGVIPSSLSNLQSLKKLDLSYNMLTGSIPASLTSIRGLGVLDLSRNQLSGPIPKSIGDCKALTYINLRLNVLTGTIPKSLGKISSLQSLILYSNLLSGPIPPELGNLSALTFLTMDDNNLEGNLPKELGYLVNLTDIYMTSNKFNGSIPDTYSNLVNLETFAIGGNNLSGPIPNYFGEWIKLTKLILLGNNFNGILPPKTLTLPKLRTLMISDVSNPGISLPEDKNISESLAYVVLRNCKINGSIPENIGKWNRFIYLDLSFNNLNGDIPESFQYLTKLFLTNNTFTELPSWITNKSNRYSYPETDLSYNDFNVKCENIKCLGLEDVNIHPTRYFIAEMRMEKCHRKHNSLFINSGGEEVTIGKDHYHNDTSTASFNRSPSEDWAYSFSGDYFWATINNSTLVRNSTCEVSSPEAKLQNNFRLAPVSLTYYGLCLRKGTYFVTPHFAETLFSKEEDNSRVGKRVFDVYIQKQNVMKDLNIKEIPGEQNEERKLRFRTTIHDGSLEIQFFWAGKGSLYNPPAINGPLVSAISVTRVPRKLHPWEIVVITVSCILFLLLLLAFMWRMGWIGDRELRETKVTIRERDFTLKQIIDATNKFKTELGRGRSGIVYKGELPGLTVAVKKLFSRSKAVDEIAREVYAKKVLDLKHENLVPLLATYSKNQLHLLIYEYMEHGSLKQALFDSNSTVDLNWENRFNICWGIAKGLKHLHEKEPQIIHRNIKSTNILLGNSERLDTKCNAKISDFGLAKFYEEESQYNIMQAGGDASYMAPEYATRGAITVKIDVYSFGILLLEIVSGKNNADYSGNQESVFLLNTAGKLHAKGKLAELVDERMIRYNWDQANTVLTLAIMCVDLSPSIRPSMSQILSVLEGKQTVEQVSKEVNTSA